ncbi:hypothetical protein BJ508DRAFT_42293 [Ascobolus immersus RN42]|uniref:Uncharacterized protein n=1 Tax=Ascobolus immersus RN42 TaxID=1160509 RepID=A0A3N4IFG2_ASCIM|nr:hypothetical protein BJ508DRAFT_42293 [Ascobolus immersus RN42]
MPMNNFANQSRNSASAVTAAASPENQYPNEAAFSLRKANSCTQTYTDQDRLIDFEYNLGPLCNAQLGPCLTFGQYPLVYEGKGGWAYYGGTASPVLFDNLYNWYALNCSRPEFVGKPEALACGTSTRALLSPGSSPYNPSLPARFSTIDFPNTYLYFNLKSLYITPMVNGSDTKAAVTFKGFKKNGATVTHVVNSIDNKKRSPVSFPTNFVDLIAFDISVKKTSGGSQLYAFALDDISVKEHVKDTLPASCVSPIPTGVKGPCTPKPTETKKITINFDDIPITPGDVLTSVPVNYKGITWPGYGFVYTKDTINTIYNQVRMRPGETIPPSGKNFLHSIGNYEWSAATADERFNLDELSLLCEFPPWADPDYANQNGRPCGKKVCSPTRQPC